jgi:hypothetical protein
MLRIRNRTIATLGALALSGGVFAASALPASAAPANVAYAVGTSGLLGNLPALAEASYPGTSPVSIATVNANGLVTAKAATDTAGPTSASSTIADVEVPGTLGLSPASIKTVTSSCSYNSSTNTVSGTTSIVGGQLLSGLSGLGGLGGLGGLSGLVPVSLPANPAPNTTLTVPGVLSITLNKQVSSGGTLEVDAVAISLLGTAETITIGTSICNSATLTG